MFVNQLGAPADRKADPCLSTHQQKCFIHLASIGQFPACVILLGTEVSWAFHSTVGQETRQIQALTW